MLEEGEIHYCVYEKRMLYHILAATSFLLWVPYSCAALYIAYCDSFSIVSDEGGFPRPHRNYPAIYYLFFREGFDLLLFMYHAVPVFLFSLIVASISTWLAMMPKRFTLSYLVAFSWFLGIISFYFWSTDVVHTSKTESFLTSSNPSQSSPWERLQAKGVSWASESWGNGPLPAPFVLQRFSGSSVFSSTCNETNSSSSLFSWLNSCGSHLPSSPVMWDANFFSFLLKHGLVRVDDHLPTPPSWMWLVVSLSTGAISAVLCKALDRLHWKQERKHYAMWKSREDISSKQGQLDVSGGEPSNDSMAQYSAMSPASSAPFIAYSSSSHGKLPSPASLAENSARHVPAAYSSPSSNLMWSISCFPSQKGIADGEEALTRSANATPPAAKRRDRIVIRPRPRKDTRKSTVATIHLSLVIPFCTGQWFSMMLRYGWRGFLIQNIVVTVTLGFIGYSMICLQVLRKRLRRSQRATSDYQTVVLKPKTLADGTKCTEQNEVLVEMVNYRVDYVHFVYRLFSTKMGIVVLAVVAFHVYVASWMLTMIRTLHTLNALVTGAGILAEILVFDLL